MQCEDIWKLTGVTGYVYDELCNFNESQLQGCCQTTRAKADCLAKMWSSDLATEWASRNYLSVKMILASQLLFNVACYSQRKNVLLTRQYLIYYGMLTACRALIFADLFLPWRNGSLRTVGHDKIRNETVNSLQRLSKERADEVQDIVLRAKKQRELFSYSFPASGVRHSGPELNIDSAVQVAGVLCELAELNSECLEAAWTKHSGVSYDVHWGNIRELCRYDGSPFFTDRDDNQRLSYLGRNYRGPACLVSIATPGMIDDFYSAWCADDEDLDSDGFDPDHGEAPGIFQFQ